MRLRNIEGEAILLSGAVIEAAQYFERAVDELRSSGASAIDLSAAAAQAVQTAIMVATSQGPAAASRAVDHLLAVRPEDRTRNDYQRAVAYTAGALVYEGAVESALHLVAATEATPKGASGVGWQEFVRHGSLLVHGETWTACTLGGTVFSRRGPSG